MATFILAPIDGLCCGCQPAVCDGCCVIDESDSGVGDVDDAFGVSGQFEAGGTVLFDYSFSIADVNGANAQVYADATLVFDSFDTEGCAESGSDSDVPISIPAGTSSIRVVIGGEGCGSAIDIVVWSYHIRCQ